jgi:transcriptional regulator with XRE-family HTH domain
MTLAEWLKAKGLTNAEFGLRISRSAEAVRRYASGERIPDKETMPVIARETEGEVLPNDFFGIEQADQAAA